MSYYDKYLKYKTKYISLKNQIGGAEVVKRPPPSSPPPPPTPITTLEDGTVINSLIKSNNLSTPETYILNVQLVETKNGIEIEGSKIVSIPIGIYDGKIHKIEKPEKNNLNRYIILIIIEHDKKKYIVELPFNNEQFDELKKLNPKLFMNNSNP